jgi:P pilus assembly chaperone PapD
MVTGLQDDNFWEIPMRPQFRAANRHNDVTFRFRYRWKVLANWSGILFLEAA